MCKILITATNANVYHFLVPHIENFILHGHSVDLACTNLEGYDQLLKNRIKKLNVNLIYVRLKRNPFKFSNIIGIKDLKKIIDGKKYDVIWTNEPVMSIATRLAAIKARKKGTKVVYMAHGFHFFNGAPLVNWLVYYPIERFMSKFADSLITINKEDFERGKNFSFKNVHYVHGVGLNTKKFREVSVNRGEKRAEIGVPLENMMLFSVGELGSRKNHEIVIDALGKIKERKLSYVICGEGVLEHHLKKKCEMYGILDNVKFLGYRRDVAELCKVADIYVFPSQREGLGIGALEGMASGLPLISSYVNGIRDYTENYKTGFTVKPHDVNGFIKAIKEMCDDKIFREKCGKYNMEIAKKFDICNTKKEISDVLLDVVSKGK